MNSIVDLRFFRKSNSFGSNCFILSAVAILMITAAAKLYSAGGTLRILGAPDPVFGMPFRHVLISAAAVELLVVCICLAWRLRFWPVAVVAWLATIFAVYRASVSFLGAGQPCRCLGALTDALHLSPQTGDRIALFLLSYLIAGSYILLIKDLYSSRPETVLTEHVPEALSHP